MNIKKIIRIPVRLPRLVISRTLAVSLALGGCVPATQWEEASSAAEVEAEGHRRATQRLHAAEAEIERIRAENEMLSSGKAALETRLDEEERRLAQTSMDMESTKKEQEEQMDLVTQLRGELARVGDHLKSYQGDKDELSAKLGTAETRVTTLESEVELLHEKAEASKETQARLRDALDEMAGSVEEPEGASDLTDQSDGEAPQENNEDAEPDKGTNEVGENEPPAVAPSGDEVLPSEESSGED